MLRCFLPVFPALAFTVTTALGQTPVSSAPFYPAELPAVRPNPNTERAGVLHDGVLTVALEAKESAWRLDGPSRPPMTIESSSSRSHR